MQNTHKPNTTHDSDLGVMLPVDAVKNALLLGLDVALVRASHYNEDMQKCVNNAIVDGMETRNEIKELAEMCNKTGKNVMIVPHN